MRLILVLFLLGGAVWVTTALSDMTVLEATLFVGASLLPGVQSVHWLVAKITRGRRAVVAPQGRVSSPDGSVHWSAMLRMELRESSRTLGGLLGFIFTFVFGFMIDEAIVLQAEPIICCSLFGGIVGCRYWRLEGLISGAIVGLAVVALGSKVPSLAPLLLLDSQWWFAACCVPCGALFGGFLADGGLRGQSGGKSASAATAQGRTALR